MYLDLAQPLAQFILVVLGDPAPDLRVPIGI